MIKRKQNLIKIYKEDEKQIYGNLAKVFIVFAIICLFSSLFFNIGSRVASESITPPETIGPIKSKGRNAVYEVVIKASIPMNSWAFVTGQVLDSQQKYLFAFGKELWKESGRDSDGYWSESDVEYDMKVTLPKPGDYYFKFISEDGKSSDGSSESTVGSEAKITITKKKGSSLPHMWAGIIALILAIVFNEIKSQSIGKIIKAMGDS